MGFRQIDPLIVWGKHEKKNAFNIAFRRALDKKKFFPIFFCIMRKYQDYLTIFNSNNLKVEMLYYWPDCGSLLVVEAHATSPYHIYRLS